MAGVSEGQDTKNSKKAAPSTYHSAIVIARCGALVRNEASMDSSILGTLPLGTLLLVTTERRSVRCTARGGALVIRIHIVEPWIGWLSSGTIEAEALSRTKTEKRIQKDRRRARSIENHNVHASRRTSFINGEDLTRYLATASDTDDIRKWKQRAARVVVRHHQSELAAVRRRHLEKSAKIERLEAEVQALKAEEAHLTRLIFQALETPVRVILLSLSTITVRYNDVSQVVVPGVGSDPDETYQQQPRSRDDLLLATHGRKRLSLFAFAQYSPHSLGSYEIENYFTRRSRTRDEDLQTFYTFRTSGKYKDLSMPSVEWPSMTTTDLFLEKASSASNPRTPLSVPSDKKSSMAPSTNKEKTENSTAQGQKRRGVEKDFKTTTSLIKKGFPLCQSGDAMSRRYKKKRRSSTHSRSSC